MNSDLFRRKASANCPIFALMQFPCNSAGKHQKQLFEKDREIGSIHAFSVLTNHQSHPTKHCTGSLKEIQRANSLRSECHGKIWK